MDLQSLELLYFEYDNKLSLIEGVFDDVLDALGHCEDATHCIWGEGFPCDCEDTWDFQNPYLDNLIEQVGIWFDVCGEFQSAYSNLRTEYMLQLESGAAIAECQYSSELASVQWTDYPIAEIFDLFSFYDRVEHMLNYRIPIPHGHRIVDFLAMCILDDLTYNLQV